MVNLQRLDLNLLRTLHVLLSENNVTRAAQRLNLSQPSVSVQLARLREIFADPLLLPGPRGMQPTARADELRGPLRDALLELELAVAPVQPLTRPRRRRPGGWRRPTIWRRRFCCRRSTRCASPLRPAVWRCLSCSLRGWFSRRIATKWICFSHARWCTARAASAFVVPRTLRACRAGRAPGAAVGVNSGAVLPAGTGDCLAGRRRIQRRDR